MSLGHSVSQMRSSLQARPMLALPLALLSLPVIVALALGTLLLQGGAVVVSQFLKLSMSFCCPMIVEHLYMWRWVGAIHVWLIGRGRSDPDTIFHSRFLDLRVEVHTEPADFAAEPGSKEGARAPASRFVHILPQFQDNYAYLIVDAVDVVLPGGSSAGVFYFGIIVDPSDELALEPAMKQINSMYYSGQLSLQMVLTTHKHWDHQSGNDYLARTHGEGLAFYSGEASVLRQIEAKHRGALLRHGDCLALHYSLSETSEDPAPSMSACLKTEELRRACVAVRPGCHLNVRHLICRAAAGATPHPRTPAPMPASGLAPLELRVLSTPGHTRGHVVFVLLEAWETDEVGAVGGGHAGGTNVAASSSERGLSPRAGRHCLFAGDLLFSGGQGAPFEAVAEVEMLQNLHTVLAAVSADTLVFPGHEYTDMLLEKNLSEADGRMPPWRFLKLAEALHRALHRRAFGNAA